MIEPKIQSLKKFQSISNRIEFSSFRISSISDNLQIKYFDLNAFKHISYFFPFFFFFSNLFRTKKFMLRLLYLLILTPHQCILFCTVQLNRTQFIFLFVEYYWDHRARFFSVLNSQLFFRSLFFSSVLLCFFLYALINPYSNLLFIWFCWITNLILSLKFSILIYGPSKSTSIYVSQI